MRSFRTAAAALVVAASTTCSRPPDLEAARAAIRQADLDMSKASEERDMRRFLTHLAEDASFYGPSRVSHGRAEIEKSWAGFFEPGGPSLTWAPDAAEVAASGDLGFTMGAYTLRTPQEGGAVEIARGRYVTIWKRDPRDGVWRAVADSGTRPQPEAADSAAAQPRD